MVRRISPSQFRSQVRQAQSKLRSAQSRLQAEVRRAQARQRTALARLRVLEAQLHSDHRRLRQELRALASRGVDTIVIARWEWEQVPYESQIEIRSAAADDGITIEFED